MKKIHIKPGARIKKRLETMNTSAAPGCRQFRKTAGDILAIKPAVINYI